MAGPIILGVLLFLIPIMFIAGILGWNAGKPNSVLLQWAKNAPESRRRRNNEPTRWPD